MYPEDMESTVLILRVMPITLLVAECAPTPAFANNPRAQPEQQPAVQEQGGAGLDGSI